MKASSMAWRGVLCVILAAGASIGAPRRAGAEDRDAGVVPQVPPFGLPWTDRPARLERIGGAMWLTAAALGRPDPRVRRFSAMRETAREQGRRRASDMLHAWVDDELARVLAQPQWASAAHRAVDEDRRVLGVRPLVDAAAVILMGVPVASLERVAPIEGVAWSR